MVMERRSLSALLHETLLGARDGRGARVRFGRATGAACRFRERLVSESAWTSTLTMVLTSDSKWHNGQEHASDSGP